MTILAPAPACRVCGCTADDPCPLGRLSSVSCLPVPDPQGSPRLCHWCAGKEGATRCDVQAEFFGRDMGQCAMGATHTTHWRCERGHDRRLNVCRMHSQPAPDESIADDCAECDSAGHHVPVRLVSASPLYPTPKENSQPVTRSDYTHIVLLVDRSGSMRPIAADMNGGIAQLLADQAAAPGVATVTLYQFDDQFERVYSEIPPGEAPAYRLVSRGGTALLDALGRSITETGELLAALPEHARPAKVIFGVVTDGAENASKEWTRPQVTDLIKQQTETYGWDFQFISADLDAITEARGLGIVNATHFEKTSAGTRAGTVALSASVTRSRSGA